MDFNEPEPPPPSVYLHSQCLLSKWGFSDGDELSWLMEHGFNNHKEVLVELVKTKLLPALEQSVEVEIISTSHNPIRAVTVNGVDVTHFHYESMLDIDIEITPESVEVPSHEIMALAESMKHAR